MNPERDKYRKIYRHNAIPGYGSSCHGNEHIPYLSTFKSLIDIGCGNNELVKELRRLKPKSYFMGLDFASTKADLIMDIIEEQSVIPHKRFDILTAFDVMEHLQPSQLSTAFTNMAGISKQFMLTISFVESQHTVNGEPLHMTVRAQEWWTNAVGFHADSLAVSGNLFTGVWR